MCYSYEHGNLIINIIIFRFSTKKINDKLLNIKLRDASFTCEWEQIIALQTYVCTSEIYSATLIKLCLKDHILQNNFWFTKWRETTRKSVIRKLYGSQKETVNT